MASKTITDLGSARARYSINREAGGAEAMIDFQNSEDQYESATFTQAELVALTTTAQRTAFLEVLDILFAEALVKKGYS
jgi:hypothetical protein